MKRALRLLSSLVLLTAGAAHARDLHSFDASYSNVKAAPQATLPKSTLPAQVSAVDPRTGLPAFVWAERSAPPIAGLSAEAAARAHLAAYASLYGADESAVLSAKVTQVHDTGRGGVIVVFRQSVSEVPLYRHDVKVLMRRDLSLVALSGSLHPQGFSTLKGQKSFSLPPAGAVARALSDLYSTTFPSSILVPNIAGEKGEWFRFDMKPAAAGGPTQVQFTQPARARKVYFPIGKELVSAYYLEIFASEKPGHEDVYGYVVSADKGTLLRRQNLTSEAAFKYRVWADTAGDMRPLDGPIADFTPHPTGVPDGSFPAYVAPALVSMEGFNKFADPWLAPDANNSRGNNVDAYTDHDDSNGPNGGDVRATITAPGEFDRVYDVTKGPTDSTDQEMAAVTQLFYVNNWLHDYWYDSGFDEAAGNAQTDNFGRGGFGNDPLRAEAQDAFDDGASNNANMSTPEDGVSPRMQMYVWDGKEDRYLTVGNDPTQLATGGAEFGNQGFDLTGELALVNDGVAVNTNACEDITNDITGKIALVDRGTCTFHEKAINVQAAGAVGMVLANNAAGTPPFMPASNFPQVNIPVLSVSLAQGNAFKTALMNGSVSVTMKRTPGVEADGIIDNLIVAHEWGHYIHHRLVACGLNQCGAESEGWGDFLALTTQLRETDNLDGVFSDSIYATQAFPDAAYFGTRRMPYSVDMTKNPLTFKHIMTSEPLPDTAPIVEVYPDNAETHNAGEVWCGMMFEGFVSILKQSKLATPKYSFDEARRRMADYVVGGMKLAPVEPTFTEQRDAIIAAAFAADPEDALLIAQGFAKRGAGSCAVSPPKDSFDNEGVVESYDVAPAVTVASITLDDSTKSCDNDGLLDANETGKVTVSLNNFGFIAATDTIVKVSSTTAGVTFPNGTDVAIADLPGFSDAQVSFDIEIDPKQKNSTIIDLTISVENAAACNPNIVTKKAPRVHYDNSAETAQKDDFESDIEAWTLEGDNSEKIWNRDADAVGNHYWHGVDYSTLSNTALVSPAVQVADSGNLTLSFRHRHKFETSNEDPTDPQTPIVFWDGSVIEITTDGGASWQDVSDFGDPGYTGQIGNLAENPLADRMGYTDTNKSYPNFDDVKINLGASFAGKTVQVRFRIGSDQAAADEGWFIDDVAFEGIANSPFPTVKTDAQSCNPSVDKAPVAAAGADQTVAPGATVNLDASGSSDPDGDELTFSWTQLSGPQVEFSTNGATATFVAPSADVDTELQFAVKVSANGLENDDTVTILVTSNADGVVPAGGCACSVPGDPSSPKAPFAALGSVLAALLLLRRRRSQQ
ncbi:MAG: M36 family metallopeptidase [Polyangiaceae bacterium]|nr:M36 family metallopeptidase [Polyangiaceae bacterium]